VRTNVIRFVAIIGILGTAAAVLRPTVARAQVRAQLAPDVKPTWDKGIQPISRESYWNAVECGKQGGANPPCVFYDTALCKNDDFTLAMFTPYKLVAYEVWRVVKDRQPAPTPSYQAAERTRITVGVKPSPGSKNPITAVVIKRGERVVKPATQSLEAGGGSFIFDFAAFTPTEDITIDFVGRARTQSCVIEQSVLARMR
jgi:hypothetical protein